MSRKKIKGRIIRILDKKTVIINLGRENHIDNGSIFYILGEPEPVIDPVTKAELGYVTVTKSRVKASQVFEKFTIATTSWVDTVYVGTVLSALAGITTSETKQITVDEGELPVKPEDIQPWKAKSQSPVKIGDEVEVLVEVPAPKQSPASNTSDKSENETGKSKSELGNK